MRVTVDGALCREWRTACGRGGMNIAGCAVGLCRPWQQM